PDPHGPGENRCRARGSDPVAIGADRHGPDFTVVLAEGENPLIFVAAPAGRVPEPDGGVRSGGGDPPAVRAERHAPAILGVSAEAEHLPPARRLPEAHHLVFPDRGEAPVVGAEGNVVY